MAKSTTTYWNPLQAEHRGRWDPVSGLEGMAEAVTLSVDPESGAITRLTRFLPGADTTPFGAKVHPYPEEVFIVSGRLFDGAFGRWLEPGDYASRPPGERHGPFRTDEGCLVLEVSFPVPEGPPAPLRVRAAGAADAEAIAAMAVALTEEICRRMATRHFSLQAASTAELLQQLLAAGSYRALLALAGEEPVGFAGICEGWALYAEGPIGTLQEVYVHPAHRGRGVGSALIEATVELARQHSWRRLEVCTPPLPEFAQSLAFYERHGFEVSGGRKLRRLLGA